MDESDKGPELTDGNDTPEKSLPEHSDEPVSMYPLIPDGEESEIEYGDIGFREEEAPNTFQDPYAAEYPLSPIEVQPTSSPSVHPRDLPPWYEDEYYDDREWERIPPRLNTAIRFAIFASVIIIIGFITYNFVRGWVDDQLDPPGELGAELVIEIPQGATTDDIARILAENRCSC